MKFLSTAVLVSALTALSIPFAIAADQTAAAATEQPHAGEHHRGHEQCGTEYAQKNLDRLQQQLHLKDSQQAAWAQYKAFILGSLTSHEKGMEDRHSHRSEARESMSTPARIQEMVAHMREHADKLEKLGKQTDAFYQTLSPEQKTIFDLHWKGHHGRKHW